MMGIKVVGVRANNPSRDLPLVPATIMVLDIHTSMAQAVLGGHYLTGARTAAGSALSAQFCCGHHDDDEMLSMVVFGAGLQAACHIEAIRTVLPSLSKVTVVARRREQAESLISSLSSGPQGDVISLDDEDSVRRALQRANLVSCCTNSPKPLFDGSWVRPGCHIMAIGSYSPDTTEIDATLVRRCRRILVDTPEAKLVGDLKPIRETQTIELIGNALKNPPSSSSSSSSSSWTQQQQQQQQEEDGMPLDCTLYKAVGTAIQDIFTADLVVRKAKELGIGTNVDMS